MSQGITRAEYQQVIQKSHAIYQVLEPKLNEAVEKSNDQRLVPFTSNRLEDLEADLVALGSEGFNSNNDRTFNFPIISAGHLVGALYVLEGARLGGKVIVKALKKNEALSEIANFHFYSQEGIDNRRRWLDFKKATESIDSESPTAGAEAIAAAQAVFAFFYEVHSSTDVPLVR